MLANLPMYSMLLPLYFTLARSRVSSRCEETLVDLRRVSFSLYAKPLPAVICGPQRALRSSVHTLCASSRAG